MNGGQRHWNEETQRWEDGPVGPGQTTPPPPPRPDEAPTGPPPAPDTTVRLSRPAPHPRAGRDRRTVWTAVLLTVVAVGAAVGLAVALADGGGNGRAAGASTPASPDLSPTTPRSEPEPSPSDTTPTPDNGELPADYVLFDDPEGFRIAVPEDWWSRTATKSQYGMDVVAYRSPEGERKLQVFEVAESSPDASFELFLAPDFPKPDGFVQLSLTNLDDADFTGSLLEYAADSLDGEAAPGPWHVYDLRFVGEDGNIYAVASYGPAADGGDDELRLLQMAVSWFCPPATSCV
ncbi:hypothetical protein AB0I00_21260 [Streptomyces sp. NPDC050803]|uniref:hypothetical protein n=1 Tax=unclassified Streptomyces TaxID=2593676 RepID=UPI0034412D80